MTSVKEKAAEFIKYFSLQCKPLMNDSMLPNFEFHTDKRLCDIPFTDDDILSLIRSLNKKKSNGPDGISAQMLKICDASIVLPLKLIFSNVLSTGIFPDIWKQANVTPIHKKGSKQVVSNYRPISLLPLCGKILERIIFKYTYNHLISNNLITKTSQGFVLRIQQRTNLLTW